MKDANEIIKYFFLIFLSTELTYYIAKGKPDFFLVMGITVFFTTLFALDRYGLFKGIPLSRLKRDSQSIKKDQSM